VDFYKDFYSKRLQYDNAVKPENKEQISSFIDYLHNNKWDQTYVPSMPWFSKKTVVDSIPNLDEENIVSLCFDRVLIDASEDRVSPVHKTYWCADNPKSAWTKKVSAKEINNKYFVSGIQLISNLALDKEYETIFTPDLIKKLK